MLHPTRLSSMLRARRLPLLNCKGPIETLLKSLLNF
jgi:hypothetical protein